MRFSIVAAPLALLLFASSASAAPFGPAAPIAGFGTSPILAGLSSAAVGADGSSLIAGTRDVDDRRQAIVAEGRVGQLPVRTELLGPAGDITSQPRAAVDDEGHGAVVFARGSTAYLSVCEDGSCAMPIKVGTSALKPEPDVAVQPGNGRITVLWRGRSKSGANRLQWRITTGGKLGAVHTLGEFGDTPRLGTDASGKTVAVWTQHVTHASDPRGLRTAARRVGEFTQPTTLQSNGVFCRSSSRAPDGETIVAWLSSPAFDVQSPRAQVRVATRTAEHRVSRRRRTSAAPTAARWRWTARPTATPCSPSTARSTTPPRSCRPPSARPAEPSAPRRRSPRRSSSRRRSARPPRSTSRRRDRRLVLRALTAGAPAGFFAARSDAAGIVRRAAAALRRRDGRVAAASRARRRWRAHRRRLGHSGGSGGGAGEARPRRERPARREPAFSITLRKRWWAGSDWAPWAGRWRRSPRVPGTRSRVYDIDPDARGRSASRPPRSAADAARGADVLVVMVATPDQVEAVLFGDDGAAEALEAGAVVVIMATVGPAPIERWAGGSASATSSSSTRRSPAASPAPARAIC